MPWESRRRRTAMHDAHAGRRTEAARRAAASSNAPVQLSLHTRLDSAIHVVFWGVGRPHRAAAAPRTRVFDNRRRHSSCTFSRLSHHQKQATRSANCLLRPDEAVPNVRLHDTFSFLTRVTGKNSAPRASLLRCSQPLLEPLHGGEACWKQVLVVA